MAHPDDEERRRRERRRAMERSRRGHPVGRELASAAPPPVVSHLSTVVESERPIDLLLEVSALLTEVADGPPELDMRWLVGVLVDHESPATTVCLAVLDRLLADDVLRARVRRELRLRIDPIPEWLSELESAASDAGSRGRNRLVQLRLDDGDPAHVHARLDEAGRVAEGTVVPSGPLTTWPDCAPLVRWVVRVAPVPTSP